MSSGTRAIFLSYRRAETRHLAGRLADRLADRLESTQVFMDVDTIAPGADFAAVIAQEVASCDVLIALIGPTWSTVVDGRGRRRLDDPDDFVVLEIRTALVHGIHVIPVLVDGAVMPNRYDLPEGLQDLARRHSVRLDHETFRSDVAALLDAIDRILPVRAQEDAELTARSDIRTAGRDTNKNPPERAAEANSLGLQFAEQGDAAHARMAYQQAINSAHLGQLPGPLAGFGVRLISFLIDYAIPLLTIPIIVTYIIVFILAGIGVSTTGDGGVFTVVTGFLGGIAFVVWNSGYRQGATGQSFGRQVTKTKLVKITTGRPIGFGMALLRLVCHIVDCFPAYYGFLRPLWDPKRQTFADKIVRTVVISYRQRN